MGVHMYEKLVLYKYFFIYVSMGVHRYENLILYEIFWIVLSKDVHRKKTFNIPVFSPPYKCKKTCKNNSTFM